jgi:hypothetical protein
LLPEGSYRRAWRYHQNVGATLTGFLLPLILATPFWFAQPAYVEIKVPVGVRSDTIFVRYVLDDDFGGWVQPRPDISSYFISTIRQGTSAARFRALMYAPGCAIQTIDLPTLGPAIPRYVFVCRPLPKLTLTGTLVRSDLDGREISLEVKYVARWAQGFLGLGEMLTDIPIGGTQHAFASSSFQLTLPNLSEDPLANAADHPGDLRILAKDRASGKIVARLVPTAQLLRARMGDLPIRKEYPEPIEFAPCSARGLQLHDAIGFAIRRDAKDPCDQ